MDTWTAPNFDGGVTVASLNNGYVFVAGKVGTGMFPVFVIFLSKI